MKRKILFLVLLSVLLLGGCAKTNPKATEATPPATTDAPAALPQATVPSTSPTTEAKEAPITEPSVPEETVPPTKEDTTTKENAQAKKDVPTKTVGPAESPKVSITKNPTGETVTEGENAVFIARADHAEEIVWIAVSPDTKTVYELDKAPDAFEGLKVDGQGTEKLTLSSIPYAMDGWRIQCYFTGNGGPAYTKGAYLTVKKAAVKVDLSSFEEIIAQYQTAIQGKYDTAQMMELGLNGMIPECLKQDERARVGYSKLDMDGDGQMELVLSASSESEYYTGLIFAAYTMEDGRPKLLLESGDRSRWYYAGDGKLLHITSGSASESGWYLCKAGRDLAYLDAIEYNAGEHPDDPWLKFTGETWEHTTQSEAEQKITELTNLVSNMEMTAF